MRAIKVFHALPLSGFTDDENKSRIEKEDEEIKHIFESAGIDIVILHPHMNPLEDDAELKQLRTPNLYYFGLSLAEGISKADMIVFGHHWRSARGCLIEELIAKTYNIPYIELAKIYTTEKLVELAKKSIER